MITPPNQFTSILLLPITELSGAAIFALTRILRRETGGGEAPKIYRQSEIRKIKIRLNTQKMVH